MGVSAICAIRQLHPARLNSYTPQMLPTCAPRVIASTCPRVHVWLSHSLFHLTRPYSVGWLYTALPTECMYVRSAPTFFIPHISYLSFFCSLFPPSFLRQLPPSASPVRYPRPSPLPLTSALFQWQTSPPSSRSFSCFLVHSAPCHRAASLAVDRVATQ